MVPDPSLLILLVALFVPFLLVIVLSGLDLVMRRERVSPAWWSPVVVAIVCTWVYPLSTWDTGYGIAQTHEIPRDVSTFSMLASWVLLASVLGLAIARGLATGPRGDDRPSLAAPAVPVLVAVGGAVLGTVVLQGVSGLWSWSQLMVIWIPWWLAAGREAGQPRVDHGRGSSAAMLVLACVAAAASGIAARGVDRSLLDTVDLGLITTAGLLAAVPALAGRPPMLPVVFGTLVLAVPAMAARWFSMPDPPVEVPALVGLDGERLQLRPERCEEQGGGWSSCDPQLVDVFHWYGDCLFVGRHGEIQVVPATGPAPATTDCIVVATPDTPLGALEGDLLDGVVVDGGRFLLSGTSGDQTLLVEQVHDGVHVSARPDPVPLGQLASVLRELGEKAGEGNDVRIYGPEWTVQQAVSICVTAYDAGFLSCTLVGGSKGPFASGQMLLSPFEVEHPELQLDTGDARGAP